MYIFYSVIILSGVASIVGSILVLMFDKRKVMETINNMNIKHEEIVTAINDAEQIVMEMNNFTDYVFERIDNKTKQIDEIIMNKEVEEPQIKKEEKIKTVEIKEEKKVKIKKESASKKKAEKVKINSEIFETQLIMNLNNKAVGFGSEENEMKSYVTPMKQRNTVASAYANNVSTGFRIKEPAISKIDLKAEEYEPDVKDIFGLTREKVIVLNPRHKDIHTLFESGMKEIEIAKKLNLGQGEVKLILGLKK